MELICELVGHRPGPIDGLGRNGVKTCLICQRSVAWRDEEWRLADDAARSLEGPDPGEPA